MKRWIVIAVAAVVFLITLVAIILSPGKVSAPGIDGSAVADFGETGNIVKNNPGFKKDALYLVYEKPGQPALNVELIFTASSTCGDGGGASISCMAISAYDYGFASGARARVTGARNASSVNVYTIEHIN